MLKTYKYFHISTIHVTDLQSSFDDDDDDNGGSDDK
jgi:hypothetical protein